ncbi:SUMO-specific isopeptidase USPL1-like [Hydractinia symbiolongicarpus]|uniref:SUMO-specific isopeptidase USPL1-like n=1 Tax=Hydractinia symbiolongicarpus TaxID=13093 RepID=UPI002549D6AC|nr:SUMO-specific isopeptidase USPL1-like [Hydractinia symbiolongicarpus]
MVMMALNRYCSDCMKKGEFLPLRFVMMNISSGVWICPKDECIFPMNSSLLMDYIEDNVTSERVLRLTRPSVKKNSMNKKLGNTPPGKLLSEDQLKPFAEISPQWSYSSRSYTSGESSSSLKSNESNDNVSSKKSTISSDIVLQQGPHMTYPLWENDGLLCWLDAALAMLVLNTTLRETKSKDETSLVNHLIKDYQKLLNAFNLHGVYTQVRPQLRELRQCFLKFLQPKLLSSDDQDDSPLFLLPFILKADEKLYADLEVDFTCRFHCNECGFEKTDGFNKMIISLPNCNEDLSFDDNIHFSRACYHCFKAGQRTQFHINRHPKIMFVHFKEGVTTRQFWNEFNFTGPDNDRYIVTQIIQYLHKKRHFVLWSYSFEEKLWLQADDLKEHVVNFKYKQPRCRPEEVHLVIWERLSVLQAVIKTKLKVALPKLELSSPLDSPSVYTMLSRRFGASRCSSKTASIVSSDGLTPLHSPSGLSKVSLIKGMQNVPRFQPYMSKQKGKQSLNKSSQNRKDTGSNKVKLESDRNNESATESTKVSNFSCTSSLVLTLSEAVTASVLSSEKSSGETNDSVIAMSVTSSSSSETNDIRALPKRIDVDTTAVLNRVKDILSVEFEEMDIFPSKDETKTIESSDSYENDENEIDFQMGGVDVISDKLLDDILDGNL